MSKRNNQYNIHTSFYRQQKNEEWLPVDYTELHYVTVQLQCLRFVIIAYAWNFASSSIIMQERWSHQLTW